MSKYLCEDLQRQLDVHDRIYKIEIYFLPLCDNAISNYQEYHKLSGNNIDMYLKRIQDIKNLFYRIKENILEYCGLDPSLEDLLYLSIQECAKLISQEFEESKKLSKKG